MKSESVVKLYYSPFERSARTAGIVSAINEIPSVKEKGLSEWRQVDEPETRVRKRVVSVFEHVVTETADIGPIGLVSHGGPIALLLLELGMDREELASYRKMFDTSNPLPPAGVWKVEQISDEGNWNFRLAFIPKVNIARGLSY